MLKQLHYQKAWSVALFLSVLIAGGNQPTLAAEYLMTGPPITAAPTAAPKTTTIEAAELSTRIAAGTTPYILDVRTVEEFAKAHLPGAINITHTELADRLGEISSGKSAEMVVMCRSGRRAQLAEEILDKAGFTYVRDLTGHMLGWQASGLATESDQ